MPVTGSQYDLPETYRLTLALSIALLAHILLIALGSLPLQPVRPPLQTSMVVTLVPAGSQLRKPSQPVTDATPRTDPAPEVGQVTTLASPNKVQPAPHTQPVTVLHQQKPAQPARKTGAHSPVTVESAPEAPVAQLTERTAAPDPFRQALMNKIARALPAQPGQADLTQLEKAVSVELELQLTKNGTLRRAIVSRSSGNPEIDRWAYRAALSSSPFSKPPSEDTEKDRYRVEIRFHPERL